MPPIANQDPNALPPALLKLKKYLSDAINKQFDPATRFVFVPTSDLALSDPIYSDRLDTLLSLFAITILGAPKEGDDPSQDIARKSLKTRFPVIYDTYKQSQFPEINGFFNFEKTHALYVYGNADGPEQVRIMSTVDYIRKLKERMQAEGWTDEDNV